MRDEIRPGWLQAIVVRLGVPVFDEPSSGVQRWMWDNGDVGLRVAKRRQTWELFAWTPVRSVVLCSERAPTSSDYTAAAALAGLGYKRRPTPTSVPAVAFAPGVAQVPK